MQPNSDMALLAQLGRNLVCVCLTLVSQAMVMTSRGPQYFQEYSQAYMEN